MAGGIRGITVKIGGDTTELGRALSDATTKSTALQKELKGVNTLLKMDPSNVTLLKQKADLLKNAIGETKDKLDALKEVLAKADRGEIQLTEAEYRNLQREIASTNIRLNELNETQKEFGSVGAQIVAQVGEGMKKVGDNVEDAGKKLSKLSAVSGTILTGSVVMASNFTDAMAKVNTIADTSAVSLDDLSSQILDLSNNTGIGADEIADATYNAISAGQDTADAVNFVSNATSLAKAGFTDTGSAIDILTTIMNAYGLEASEVGRVSDILIQTQNKGKTTVAELSSSMGKIIPTANAMGVSLEQISAGYSIMTANGIATAESTTYMNSMLNELGKSSTKVGGILKDQTGKSFQELIADGNSLGDVLQILQDYSSENGIAFNELWGSAEAGKAGLTLLSGGVDEFNGVVKEMGESVGSTNTAMTKLETPSQKAKVAINQLKNSAITLGQSGLNAITPLLNSLGDKIKNITTWFNELSPEVQRLVVTILALVTALGPVLIILGKVISAVGSILTVVPKIVSGVKLISTGLKGLFTLITANPVIAIITAIVVALTLLWTNCEEFRDFVINAWETIKNALSGVVEWLGGIISSISDAISSFIEWIGSAFETVKNFFINLWNGIVIIFTPAIEWFSNLFGSIYNTLSSVVNNIIAFLRGIWLIITTLFSIVYGWFKDNVIDPIANAFSVAWEGIASVASSAWNTIKTVFSAVYNWFKSTVIDPVVGVFSGLWNTLKNGASSAWEGIKSIFSSVATFFGDIFSTAWQKVKDVFSVGGRIFDGIKDGILNGFKTIVNAIIKGINKVVAIPFDGINVALTTLRDIDILGIKPFDWISPISVPQIPLLAKGGIVNGATPFIAGEDGKEVIIPLEKNTEWTRQVAKQMSEFSDNNTNSAVVTRLDAIYDKLDRLKQSIVLDTGVLVGETINEVDSALNDVNDTVLRGW